MGGSDSRDMTRHPPLGLAVVNSVLMWDCQMPQVSSRLATARRRQCVLGLKAGCLGWPEIKPLSDGGIFVLQRGSVLCDRAEMRVAARRLRLARHPVGSTGKRNWRVMCDVCARVCVCFTTLKANCVRVKVTRPHYLTL